MHTLSRRPEVSASRDHHRWAVHSVPERRAELVAVRHGLPININSVRALDFDGAFYALVSLHPSWPPKWLVSYVMLRLQEEMAREVEFPNGPQIPYVLLHFFSKL